MHCRLEWEDKGKPSALYADGKFITWTEPGAVISFPIHPGQHLLTLSSDGHIASVMLQFQVNKLYYLRILPTSRGAGPITLDWVELIPISEDKYSKVMIEGSCNYAQTLPDRMGQDMAPVDYNEALEDFRDDAKTGSRFERWLNEYNGF